MKNKIIDYFLTNKRNIIVELKNYFLNMGIFKKKD